MGEELKPCPFCGFKGQVLWDKQRTEHSPYHWVLYCAQCGASVKGAIALEAREAWNRRTPEPMTSVVKWVRYENDPTIVPLNTLLLVEYRDAKGKKVLECMREWCSLIQVQADMLPGAYFATYPEVPTGPEPTNAGA